MTGSSRLAAAVLSTALAALVVQPLAATPSYAGAFCGTPAATGDCTPPETTITSGPSVDGNRETESRTAAFTFEAPDESADDQATFECRLDRGQTVVQDWEDCTDATPSRAGHSTGSASYSDLALGSYTFSVRGTDTPDTPVEDANTESTPATFGWTVVEPDGPPPPDTEDPRTVITVGAQRWHPYSFLGIRYRSNEEASGFECTLNGQERRCDDDQATLLGMGAGDYRFTVAARDTAGNLDPTPAVERWTVPMSNTQLKTHSREWDKRSGRGHFQDTYSITDERGAFIEQAKQGFRSLVLVATRCPGCGRVAVLLRGRLIETVDLGARQTRKRQVVRLGSWARPQTGKVRLEVLTQGKDVLVEGMGFSARR